MNFIELIILLLIIGSILIWIHYKHPSLKKFIISIIIIGILLIISFCSINMFLSHNLTAQSRGNQLMKHIKGTYVLESTNRTTKDTDFTPAFNRPPLYTKIKFDPYQLSIYTTTNHTVSDLAVRLNNSSPASNPYKTIKVKHVALLNSSSTAMIIHKVNSHDFIYNGFHYVKESYAKSHHIHTVSVNQFQNTYQARTNAVHQIDNVIIHQHFEYQRRNNKVIKVPEKNDIPDVKNAKFYMTVHKYNMLHKKDKKLLVKYNNIINSAKNNNKNAAAKEYIKIYDQFRPFDYHPNHPGFSRFR